MSDIEVIRKAIIAIINQIGSEDYLRAVYAFAHRAQELEKE